MKFTKSDVSEKELKAFLHSGGCLIIQTGKDCIAFDAEGCCLHEDTPIDFWEKSAKEKFYTGDSVTITF